MSSSIGWALVIALLGFLLGAGACYALLARVVATVPFWVGLLRAATPTRRMNIKIALMAAEMIVDPHAMPPPPGPLDP